MPLISVIMSVYNSEPFLRQAIDSVLAQTFSDFEFIIVDDASTDGCPAIIQRYAQADQRIHHIRLARNQGLGHARHVGLAHAKGKYIANMDSDDVRRADCFERQVEFLRAYPEIGAVGTGVEAVRADMSPLFTYKMPSRHAMIVFSFFVGQGIVFGAMLARRELVVAQGGFNQAHRESGDTDLLARMIAAGTIRFANLPQNLYTYRRHPASLSMRRAGTPSAPSLNARRFLLERLWNEAPAATLERFYRMRNNIKLGWLDRRRARRDMQRLIDSLIAAKWVDASDRAMLEEAMQGRLESAMPRRWQQFLHWRRRRLPYG